MLDIANRGIRGQVLIIPIVLTCLHKLCISIYYYTSQLAHRISWCSLGEHLYMGRSQGVSQYVSGFGKSRGFETSQYKKMTGRINT